LSCFRVCFMCDNYKLQNQKSQRKEIYYRLEIQFKCPVIIVVEILFVLLYQHNYKYTLFTHTYISCTCTFTIFKNPYHLSPLFILHLNLPFLWTGMHYVIMSIYIQTHRTHVCSIQIVRTIKYTRKYLSTGVYVTFNLLLLKYLRK